MVIAPEPRKGGMGFRIVTFDDGGNEICEDEWLPGYQSGSNQQMERLACVEGIRAALKHPRLPEFNRIQVLVTSCATMVWPLVAAAPHKPVARAIRSVGSEAVGVGANDHVASVRGINEVEVGPVITSHLRVKLIGDHVHERSGGRLDGQLQALDCGAPEN